MSSHQPPLLQQQASLFKGFKGQGAPLAAFDVGTKTIGLAVSDPMWAVAMPVQTLRRSKKWADDVVQLAAFCAERQVAGIVVGWPLNMDGTQGPKCQSVLQFLANLHAAAAQFKPHMPALALWDERLSTVATNRTLIDTLDTSRQKRKDLVDQLAAQFILDGALAFLNRD